MLWCPFTASQISYAIGVAEPLSIHVDTYGTAKEGVNDKQILAAVKKVRSCSICPACQFATGPSPLWLLRIGLAVFGGGEAEKRKEGERENRGRLMKRVSPCHPVHLPAPLAQPVFDNNDNKLLLPVCPPTINSKFEKQAFDFRPGMIAKHLDLMRGGNSRYQKTAAYGHFGRDDPDFTWETVKPLTIDA